jgi:hypothetical protein
MKNKIVRLINGIGLLFAGSAMAFSGFLIQLKYHIGHHNAIEKATNAVLGINYLGWSSLHKISIIIFSMLMIFHLAHHLKWYTTIIRKKLIAKNKLMVALTAVFIFVAITGYIPWFINLSGGSDLARKAFIEVHDKFVFILSLFLIIHSAKKIKWFIARGLPPNPNPLPKRGCRKRQSTFDSMGSAI